ncbi:MAG: hypothetical protein QXH78_02295 [Desulfurococcaceae archaeon]
MSLRRPEQAEKVWYLKTSVLFSSEVKRVLAVLTFASQEKSSGDIGQS